METVVVGVRPIRAGIEGSVQVAGTGTWPNNSVRSHVVCVLSTVGLDTRRQGTCVGVGKRTYSHACLHVNDNN